MRLESEQALSVLSISTILIAASAGFCSSKASAMLLSQRSTSSGVISITGMAFSWIGFYDAVWFALEASDCCNAIDFDIEGTWP